MKNSIALIFVAGAIAIFAVDAKLELMGGPSFGVGNSLARVVVVNTNTLNTSGNLPSTYVFRVGPNKNKDFKVDLKALDKMAVDHPDAELVVAAIYSELVTNVSVRVSEFIVYPPITPPDKFEQTHIYKVKFAKINGQKVEIGREFIWMNERQFREETSTNRVYLKSK